MGRLVVAATMTFDMITELIYNMTIHITTYDTCVYVDNSVDFVDYLEKVTKKPTVVPNSTSYDILQLQLQ